MVWLPDDKKTEDVYTRFDRIHERDGRTDGQTPHNGIGSAYAYAMATSLQRLA